MSKVRTHQQKIEIDITDVQLTGRGGLHCISAMASRLQLLRILTDAIHVKKRQRGCDDTGSLHVLIYSLASGDGALRDLDAFRQDTATLTIVGM